MATTASTTPINVGVIGYGLSAKVFHIPLILTTPALRLHSILQRTPQPLPPALTPLNIQIHSTLDALISSPCSLIIITTPPQTHFSLCSTLLTAGKHVLIEKPFVPTSAEASTLIALAAKHSVLLCVYQNRRWDTDFLTFQALRHAGTLGRIVSFDSHFDRYRPVPKEGWKTALRMEDGGGVLFDLGSHLLDQMVAAFGMPRSVSAVFVKQREGILCTTDDDEPDAITVTLLYADGLVATAHAGVMSAMAEQLRFRVLGTKGSFVKYHMDVQEEQLKAGMLPGEKGFGVEAADKAGVLCTAGGAGGEEITKVVHENVTPVTYGKLYEEFAAAILSGDPSKVPVKAEEARDVLRIIEAARESVRTGRRVEL